MDRSRHAQWRSRRALFLPAGKPFHPDPDEVEALITPRTRALVIINPNNPTGAVYPREVLERLARIAEKHQLVVLSDEIYDGITYDNVPFVPIASLVTDTLCATLSGLVEGLSRRRLSRGLGQFLAAR